MIYLKALGLLTAIIGAAAAFHFVADQIAEVVGEPVLAGVLLVIAFGLSVLVMKQ